MPDNNAQPRETLDIVEEVKAALHMKLSDGQGNPDPVSDYRVAQMLGVSRATVSKWRQNKGGMSDATALRAAALTGAEPAYYLLRVAMERTESIGAADVLERLVKKLRRSGRAVITAKIASVLFGTFLVLGQAVLPAQRVAAAAPEGAPAVCILSKIVRRWLRALQRLALPAPGSVTVPAF